MTDSIHIPTLFAEAQELLLAEMPEATGFHLRASNVPTLTPPPVDALVIGSIGFAGDAISGAVTLAAPRAVWETVAPDLGPPPIDSSLVGDMVGELCNMVLGRFRNSLLRRGVHVGCATPTFHQGPIATIAPPAANSSWSVLDRDGGELYLRLDVAFADDFAFHPANAIEPNVEDLVFF